jgi:hypothetical protein
MVTLCKDLHTYVIPHSYWFVTGRDFVVPGVQAEDRDTAESGNNNVA